MSSKKCFHHEEEGSIINECHTRKITESACEIKSWKSDKTQQALLWRDVANS